MSVSTFYTHFGSKERAYQLVMGEDPPKQSASAPSLTGRALRTRNAIVVAARVCIERDRYHAARITDIAEQAGVAVGTFYTYFSSKDDVFAEVLDRAVAELQDSTPETLSQPTDGSGPDASGHTVPKMPWLISARLSSATSSCTGNTPSLISECRRRSPARPG